MKIKNCLLSIAGMTSIVIGITWYNRRRLEKQSKIGKRYQAYYSVTNQWIDNKNKGRKLEQYFKEKNVASIAIYGMGSLGRLLLEDLKGSDIEIKYIIDNNAENIDMECIKVPIIRSDELAGQQAVQMTVVTPVTEFKSIKEKIQNSTSSKIISLEDVVFWI
jgi:FlaA1/EpsC-like NDP-sugar epimerase